QVYNLSLSIDEGLPPETIVGDIRAGLQAVVTPNTGFFISESRESAVFTDLDIDVDTGIIRTAKVLDRETRDGYRFVAATLFGDVVQVEIVVNDVNDHPPVFPRASLQLNVSEQSPAGTRFPLDGALDPDAEEFSTRGYAITRGDPGGVFKLHYKPGPGGVLNLDLVLETKLDRETTEDYSITIEAFDGGEPPRTGQMRVDIRVLDENDNPPLFNQTEYQAFVWENAGQGISVGQVYASDLDLGDNAAVKYQINRRQSDPGEYFIIDSITGIITLNKALDYEDQPLHKLVVQAKDGGAQPESSSTFFIIKVLDINDNSPTIDIIFLTETGQPEVSEGAAIGDYVARISVSDPDLHHQAVHISLEGSNKMFALQARDDFLYFLCVNGALDRETQELYEVKVSVSDLGAPPLWSERTVLLRVTDLNDNPPVFELKEYKAQVSEAASPGTAVLQVRAKDLDEGMNSDVQYSILHNGDTALFHIDPLTGVIVTSDDLDHEKQPVVVLLVVATDSGSPSLSSTSTVIVQVEDVNDNEPIFEQQVYDVSVQEHTALGACFIQVTATDADSGPFGTVRYSLYEGFNNYEKSQLFRIDPDSGQICVSQDIDKEEGPASHDVLVKAEDGGGLSAQAFVRIQVEDINDNPPVFNPVTYVTSISSHTQPGTEILNVIASDRDSGTYGDVSYELVSGDLSSLFTVDSSTGIIYLTSTLSHLKVSHALLSVSARDGGDVTSVVPAAVTVNILQSALAPAVFERTRYSFTIPEDALEGSPIGTVRATNPSNSLEPISYRISSGDPYGYFTIDSQFGVIRSKEQLDHEAQRFVILTVRSETDSSPVYSSTQVNITVTDVNDNKPVFQKQSETVKVSSSTPPGAILYIAHAEDRDSGSNGMVMYSLEDNINSMFTIDPGLGVVFLNKTLSTDMRNEYNLKVLAKDKGVPPLSSLFTLNVIVDHNSLNGSLTFENLVYLAEVSENAPPDTRVLQVQTHGPVPQVHSKLVYSLEPTPSTGLFSIHPGTGWIVLRKSLDYETAAALSFRVFASNPEDHSHSYATASVTISVLDENDNPPFFTQDSYFFSIEEGPVPYGLVGTVTAADNDSGRNSQLSYILLTDRKYFRINSRTGEIINWVALDREQHTHHQLSVLVSDHGTPRHNATATVYIVVNDINDNPPQFPQQSFAYSFMLAVSIPDSKPRGSFVATVYAKDLDAGENGTVLYSVSSEDGLGHFKIDSKTGDLKTNVILSYRLNSHYRLMVTASDQGKTPLHRTVMVNIQVIPRLQKRSKFGHHERHFSIPEHFKPGQVIGCLKSHDQQLLANKEVDYTIIEGDENFHFGIDSSAGNLYLTQELDYETASYYFLKINVKDASRTPPQNNTIFVTINVEDQNDHSPWFLDDLLVIGIDENVPLGSPVYTFNAKDGDGSYHNSNLLYSIVLSNSVENPFHIDPLQGTLTAEAPIDREVIQTFVLTVTATDQAANTTARKSCSLTAKVIVFDVNDNSPTFVSPSLSYVMEDAELGSAVHHVVAQDPDENRNGKVFYSILSGNEQGTFRLDETSGLLTLTSFLDHEVTSSYTLAIMAQDDGIPAHSSTQMLMVVVVDVNDDVPVFTKSLYDVSVPENRNLGEFVIKMEAVDRDSGVNSVLSYEILPGAGYGFFRINSKTGEITTTAVLDRETQATFSIKVLVRDGGTPSLSSTAQVLCSVLDENDHTPEFLLPASEVHIPENQDPGIIYTVRAVDKDTGDNGAIRYQIVGGNPGEYFTINALSGEISATRGLNREDISNFSIILESRDLGVPQRSSTAQLQITVLDENDNSPAFDRSHYRTSVAEDVTIGSVVLQLIATDQDQGANGELMYSLIDDTLGTFGINSTTGVIVTTKELDRETKSTYIFRAVASDCSIQGPRSTTVNVMIHVEDVNDNAPVFIHSPLTIYVSVETGVNQTVATVRADDVDLGLNGAVVFSFVQEDSLFSISRQTGEIWVQTPLPASYFGMRVLQVTAADQGVPVRSTTGLVVVHMRGQEKGLWFSHNSYEATVPENSKAGTSLVKVEAYEQGPGRTKIKYRIFSGDEHDTFSINPGTGEIIVRDPKYLDFEVQAKIHLVVLAENDWETAHCKVTVTTLDANDNPPRFEQGYHRTSVWEGQIFNTYIMQVFATDPDSGLNGQIEYSIISGNQNEAFLIDSVRGILATNAILDREIVSSYRLVLQAADRGDPRLSATCTVKVQVVDVNDNAPTIPPLPAVEIAENLPPGYTVLQVSANDMDSNPTLSYSFTASGNPGGKFAIDRYTGVVTLSEPLDFEETSQYTLRIKTSDSVHETEASLKIRVLDINDNPPRFSQDLYQISLPELTPVDAYVLTVSATDPDSNLNGNISYRILSSASKGFNINPKNGSIFTNVHFKDAGMSSMIQLLVEAKDGGNPALIAITSVEVQITDVNNYAPQFTQAWYNITVTEDTAVGDTVLSFSATDLDWTHENSYTDYSVISGNEQNKFHIETSVLHSETSHKVVGKLILTNSLDRETTSTYTLVMLVSDRGTPTLNSTATVQIILLDANDNPPVFISLEYHIQVSESTPVGSTLTHVSASDPDEGANSDITYIIISGNDKGHFRLDPKAGSVELDQSLDYEEDTKFTLTIQASDNGTTNINVAFSVLFISVLDHNDYAPFFMFPTLNCFVRENLPAYTAICTVSALDFDTGPYGQLTYSIQSSCLTNQVPQNEMDLFIIDPLTGDIQSKQMFDYERQNTYCLVVQARDKGGATATVSVEVDINGDDEFDPVFTQDQYYFSLPENTAVGQSVGQVRAMDNDGGLDGVILYSIVEPSLYFSVNKTSGGVYLLGTIHRRKDNAKRKSDIIEFWIKAYSPKLDSRSAHCFVTVNISKSLEAFTAISKNTFSVSLTVSFVVFLLLTISLVGLVLRYKRKADLSPNSNSYTGKLIRDYQKANSNDQSLTTPEDSAEHMSLVDIRVKKESVSTCRHSNSSGHGSAEGETAEDEEIKMINEHPCRKDSGSALSERASRVPDSGIPRDSDQLSCQSEDTDVVVSTESVESIHNFKDEGGGEGCDTNYLNGSRLSKSFQKFGINEKYILKNGMADNNFISDGQNHATGSLTSLISTEEELRGSYNWNYLLSWEPSFQPLSSVFSDIAKLNDENILKHNSQKEPKPFIFPPPLITSVAQPGIRAVPPRMPSVIGRPAFPKYSHSPLSCPPGSTFSAMTPSFSPALSLLTMQTPTASP
uniref:Protocadherin-16 n=1 Tax=Latimeria chalumnae TaxID=7897 RepID=H2ZZL6_LATCH